VRWLLNRGYQALIKGASSRRAAKLARQVRKWQPVRQDRFIGCVDTPVTFARPVRTFVIRRVTSKRIRHAYLFSTLRLSAKATLALYDERGAAEIEIRKDKSGGGQLHKRRKQRRDAQEAWVLLTDIAHNFWAWFARTILVGSTFADYGPLRISRDLMRVPGFVELRDGQLVSVRFLKSVPQIEALITCFERLCE
jgi:hypothetical protein